MGWMCGHSKYESEAMDEPREGEGRSVKRGTRFLMTTEMVGDEVESRDSRHCHCRCSSSFLESDGVEEGTRQKRRASKTSCSHCWNKSGHAGEVGDMGRPSLVHQNKDEIDVDPA